MSSTHQMGRGPAGFTLVEVMVAIAIFSVIAAFSYATFSEAATTSRSINRQMVALIDLQRAMQTLSNDFAQYQPRPVREPIGTANRAPLLADARNDYLFELTRSGYANPLGAPRATSQRVAYRLDEEQNLLRIQWPVLDPVLASEPIEIVIMEEVIDIEILYLGDGGQDDWSPEWPRSNNAGAPRAVEITIEHPLWGEIRRLLEIRG